MQLFQTRYRDLIVHLDFAQEILDLSYPNQNYNLIADYTFEHLISDLKNKAPNKLDNLLKQTKKSIYFLCAHSKNTKENKWIFFDKKYDSSKLDLEKHIIQRHIKLNFDSSIINVCNSNKILLRNLPFTSLYSEHLIGPSQEYSDKEIISH